MMLESMPQPEMFDAILSSVSHYSLKGLECISLLFLVGKTIIDYIADLNEQKQHRLKRKPRK